MPHNNGGPAFPGTAVANPGEWAIAPSGMSLHDWFAGQAPPIPQAVLNEWWIVLSTNEPEITDLPWNEGVLKKLATLYKRWGHIYADVMLAARDKEQDDG